MCHHGFCLSRLKSVGVYAVVYQLDKIPIRYAHGVTCLVEVQHDIAVFVILKDVSLVVRFRPYASQVGKVVMLIYFAAYA